MNVNQVEIYEETILHSLLKATEVAKILNISRSMAYRLIQTGQIRSVRIGEACRVRTKDLQGYIEKNLSPQPN